MLMPANALVGGLWTLWLAYSSNHALVVDDYYAQGKAINLDIARDRSAASLGMQAQLQFDPQGVAVHLTARDGVALPSQIRLKALHATRAELDVTDLLTRGADGLYRGSLTQAPQGRHWRIQIDDPGRTWRLVTTADRLENPIQFGGQP
jgi:hypothetical protein